MSETIEIEVSDDTVAAEVGYGLIHRAQQIHENPHDDFEHVAVELRDIGQRVVSEHREEETFE